MAVYSFEICADPAEAFVRREHFLLKRKLGLAEELRDLSNNPTTRDVLQERVDRIQVALDAIQVSVDKYDKEASMDLGRPGLQVYR